MLATILLTVGFFVVAMGAMAIGVALTGKKLAGSCGGVGGEACSCSPEKRAQCAEKAASQASFSRDQHSSLDQLDEDERPQLNPLARPGEERLVQLGRR